MDYAQSSPESPVTATDLPRQPVEDLVRYLSEYAHERPDVVALWAFGLGFLLGFRFRLW